MRACLLLFGGVLGGRLCCCAVCVHVADVWQHTDALFAFLDSERAFLSCCVASHELCTLLPTSPGCSTVMFNNNTYSFVTQACCDH